MDVILGIDIGGSTTKIVGLDPQGRYRIERAGFYGCNARLPHAPDRIFTGGELMYGGYTLPILLGNYPSVQICWKSVTG